MDSVAKRVSKSYGRVVYTFQVCTLAAASMHALEFKIQNPKNHKTINPTYSPQLRKHKPENR